jgi:hypothetical protein
VVIPPNDNVGVMLSAEMVEHCLYRGLVIEAPLMQLLACVSVPTGTTDFTIEARGNAWVERVAPRGLA